MTSNTEKKEKDNVNKDTDTTSSVSDRYIFTNDVLSGLVIISLCLIVVGQFYASYTVTDIINYAYVVISLGAGTWLYGIDLLELYKK